MNIEQTSTDVARRAAVHAALADVTRLRVTDLLRTSDHSSSELGAALAVPSNLLAHHLKVLERAGAIHRHASEGDARRSYWALCHELRSAPLVASAAEAVSARRVIFVCTANTARSHLAAAAWRLHSDLDAGSAGTDPGPSINPGALAAAQRHRLTLSDVSPRHVSEVVKDGDLVITVCDRAHEQLGELAWAHWSVPDPVAAGTTAAFDAALADIMLRVRSSAATVLPQGLALTRTSSRAWPQHPVPRSSSRHAGCW